MQVPDEKQKTTKNKKYNDKKKRDNCGKRLYKNGIGKEHNDNKIQQICLLK